MGSLVLLYMNLRAAFSFYNDFHRYFSRQPALEGSTAKTIFFLSVLCVKAEKITKYRFSLKVIKIQKQYHF